MSAQVSCRGACTTHASCPVLQEEASPSADMSLLLSSGTGGGGGLLLQHLCLRIASSACLLKRRVAWRWVAAGAFVHTPLMQAATEGHEMQVAHRPWHTAHPR